MNDEVRVTNLGTALVDVAGLGIAPRRTGVLKISLFQSWMNRSSRNRRIANTTLQRVYGTSWGEDIVEEPAPKPKAELPREGIPPTRREIILKAMREMNMLDKTLWTKTGMPTLAAIRDATGLADITQPERAKLWDLTFRPE